MGIPRSGACGGAHLKNTGEIGEIRFLRKENKGKNNRRIEVALSDAASL